MSTFTAPSHVLHDLPYAIVDVFAERPLAGNPLAIFTDARGLSTAQMQELARETNLSETTFILPRDPVLELQDGVSVRIFTTEEELPFAGHPTLGTASWLRQNHPRLRDAETVHLRLAAGRIGVRFETPAPGDSGVFGTMRQDDPVFGAVHHRGQVAAALGLTLADLDPDLPPRTVSTGLAFCIVGLRSLDVAERLEIPQREARAYLRGTDAKFFHCITRADRESSGADWHARMQFYKGEDPATGSASGCAIAYLVQYGVVAPSAPTIFEQGIEIHRPSRIHAQARLENGRITDVFVGGRTIPVASGRFFLP